MNKQILRSGTSIRAKPREAFNAGCCKDFIHKLAIAQKECDEINYCLAIMMAANSLSVDLYTSIVNEAKELLIIIKSSILTSKRKLQINSS